MLQAFEEEIIEDIMEEVTWHIIDNSLQIITRSKLLFDFRDISFMLYSAAWSLLSDFSSPSSYSFTKEEKTQR